MPSQAMPPRIKRHIDLDSVVLMMLDLWAEEGAHEPRRGDPDRDNLHLQNELDLLHLKWQQRMEATELMIGWRLFSLVTAEREATRDD